MIISTLAGGGARTEVLIVKGVVLGACRLLCSTQVRLRRSCSRQPNSFGITVCMWRVRDGEDSTRGTQSSRSAPVLGGLATFAAERPSRSVIRGTCYC